MKPSSCKAKGRALQNAVALIVRSVFALPPEDVAPAVMGETGVDLKLSARAREVFPFAVECKKRESLNVWEALKQAEANAKKEGLRPLLVFQRNRSKAYVALPLADFVEMAETCALYKEGDLSRVDVAALENEALDRRIQAWRDGGVES